METLNEESNVDEKSVVRVYQWYGDFEPFLDLNDCATSSSYCMEGSNRKHGSNKSHWEFYPEALENK
jgi:hypothetical protein